MPLREAVDGCWTQVFCVTTDVQLWSEHWFCDANNRYGIEYQRVSCRWRRLTASCFECHWLSVCRLLLCGTHANIVLMQSGLAQPYCGCLAGSDAASSAVASAPRALFVQGTNLRHSVGKCGSFSKSCFFFAHSQDRVRLFSCDLRLSKVSIQIQVRKVTRYSLQDMHSLVPLGHTSNLKLPGRVPPPCSGDSDRDNSHIAC